MKVYFRTNLDWYSTVTWPQLPFVPRKGEMVEVAEASKGFCTSNKIPSSLEVVKVSYTERGVIVELWYSNLQKDSAVLSGKWGHLMQSY